MKLKKRFKFLISLVAIAAFSLSMAIPAIPTYAAGHSLSVTFRDNSLGHGSVQYSENSGSSWTTITGNTSGIQLTNVDTIKLKIVPDSNYEIDWSGIGLSNTDMTQDVMNALSGDGYAISTANPISLTMVEFNAASGGGGGDTGNTTATISLTAKDSAAADYPTPADLEEGEEMPGHSEYDKEGERASFNYVGIGADRLDYYINPNNGQATYFINDNTQTTDVSNYEKNHNNRDALQYDDKEVVGVTNTTAKTDYKFNYDGTSATVPINIYQSGGEIITKLTINNVDYTAQVPQTNDARAAAFNIERGRGIVFTVNVPVNILTDTNTNTTYHSYDIVIEQRPVTWSEAVQGNFGWCYNENDPKAAPDDIIAHGTIEFVKATYGNEVLTSVDAVNAKYAAHQGVFQWMDATKRPSYEGHEGLAYGEALFPPGTVITVKLVPDPGYQLTKFTLNGFEVTPGGDDAIGEYTFTFHPGNFHLGAEFRAVENDVEINSDEVYGGAIDLAADESAIDIGTVKLDVEDTNVSEAQEDAFTQEADEGGYEIANYLDISLFNTVYKGGKTDAQGNLLTWDTPIDKLNKAATVSLALEENMAGKEVVIIHELHDGANVTGYETIPCEYLAQYNAIVFETDGFSNYAIASKDLAEYTVVDESTGIEFNFTDGEGNSYESTVFDVLTMTAEQMAAMGITAAEHAEIVNTIKAETNEYGTLLKVLSIDIHNITQDVDYKGQVNIKIPISDDMKQYNVFKMIYIDPDNGFAAGDVVELKVEGDYLVGTLPHLSVYALVGSYVEASPQTGDLMNTFLMLFALGGSSLTAGLVFRKKRSII